MTVYVDPPRKYNTSLRWKTWSHMIADTEEELHAMADSIGLKREWFQKDHYDVIPTKRAEAIKLGAKVVSTRDIVRILIETRGKIE